jgi:glycosyltransferase involved in cell wall biosynthesis
MRVAIVHYWLVGMRGGEKVLEALCDIYPHADIFTHVVVPDAISAKLRRHCVKTSFIASLPRAHRWYKKYLPLMPIALEQLDLRGYDLIISSEAGPAKGIIPPPDCLHICYTHAPMRYIWNMYQNYRASAGFVSRMAMLPLSHYLRTWDQSSAARVDTFVANSQNVAARVEKYYRRESVVVHPPVAVESFERVADDELGDFYLMVGQLVAYKRPELAVQACNVMRKKLVVIGSGEMLSKLRRIAGPTVQILGAQPFERVRHAYARCRALMFPGEEDFGIVPVEAMASGRPVIAYGRGGARETVVDGVTGLFFDEPSVDGLAEATLRFETMEWEPAQIRAHAQRFNGDRFKREIQKVIDLEFARHDRSRRRDAALAIAAE